MRSRGPDPRVPRWIAPLLLGLAAFGVRALPATDVFVEGDVFPFGNDAWYHLRRISWSVVRFPEVLGFDTYINFPAGAKPIWSPAFDWIAALLVRPFYREGDLASVERSVVWLPPLLGAATVVVLHQLARRHLGSAVAVVSAAILCVLPGHFWYSQLGFVDHHAAVALCTTALLAAAMRFAAPADAVEAARLLRPGAIATGLWLGISLFVWPGSLLHVALAEVGLVAVVASRGSVGEAVAAARSFAAAQLLACAVVLPFAGPGEWVVWGDWSPVVLSRFQPWLFAGLALGAVACAGVWTRSAAGGTRPRRIASGAGLAALLVALALWAEPDLRAGVGDAWRWLARAEAFQAGVAESQPLFVQRGELALGRALERLSGFVLLAPLAWLAALAWAWRQREPRAALLLWLGWTAGLFAATVAQRRFFNTFSVSLALLMGWSLCLLWRELPARAAGRVPPRLVQAVVVALALLLLLPIRATYARHLHNALQPTGEPWRAASGFPTQRALIEMGRWLSRRTPPTAGWLDPGARPEYGVLAPWELGHALEYVARRPTVSDNFGDDIGGRNFHLAREYWRRPEPQASAILDRLGARYVVASLGHAAGLETSLDAVGAAIHLRRGSAAPAAGPGDAPVTSRAPALERHRLVYESRTWGDEAVAAPALFQVYEHVPGARITGAAPPGTVVETSVALLTNRGRELRHVARARADQNGRFSLGVPYANRGAPPSVRVADHYALACPRGEARVVVTERDVRSGAEVEAPDVCR